ncbi:hypothetical protein [Bradyrhizobium sp. LA2.1]|uniref:hypothetical protein n=1 Tax=Bradyrhizobium sp. LA2.1 TaxID=3156376 RepID=UPI003393893E
MPEIIPRQRFFVGLMGLGANNELEYPNYFAMIPTGQDPNAALTEGFFETAGHYMAPLAYSQMQVVAQAIEGTGSLDDVALSEFTRRAVFSPVMGSITFGSRGEWTHPRVLQVQFQSVVGNSVDQFRDGSRQVVVAPQAMASGVLIYPFANARGI